MTQETVIVVPSETSTETPSENQPTVAEQAAEIVETAENLAAKMARSNDETEAIFLALAQVRDSILPLLEMLLSEIREIRSEISAMSETVEEIEEMEEAEIEQKPAEEAEPEDAPIEIPPEEAAPETPQKRGRKWI